MKRAVLIVAFLLMGTLRTHAQDPAPCRLLCAPEFKIEPTVKFGNFSDRVLSGNSIHLPCLRRAMIDVEKPAQPLSASHRARATR